MLQSSNTSAILVLKIIVASYPKLYLKLHKTVVHPPKMSQVCEREKGYHPSFPTPYLELRKVCS